MKTTETPHIVELQTRTERGAWERQAINVLAENPEQAAELEAKISYCDGYNAEKHRWGDDGYRTVWHAITHDDARAVLAYARTVAESDKFKPGPTNSRAFANFYRRP